MKMDRTKHWQFLECELKAEVEEFKTKWETPARTLLAKDEVFVALFEGFKNGAMVMKFPLTRQVPRKGSHLTCMLLPKEERDYHKWGMQTYRDLYGTRFKGTDCACIWHGDCDDKRFVLVGFRGIDLEFSRMIEPVPGIVLVFAPRVPPLEYVANLQKVVSDKSSSAVASILDAQYNTRSEPPRLIREEEPAQAVLAQMALAQTVILQGPPGTGKTFTVAKICAELMSAGKSVLVTALTNRALIETAVQPSLKDYLSKGSVSKVHLTCDEAREAPGLKLAADVAAVKSELVLATFYVMSGCAADATADGMFDYVIMDEASQAYVATFAAVKKLGKNNLWVGDVNQLPPITLLNQDRVDAAGYGDLMDGLRLLSCNREYPVMRLTRTYRLGTRAAQFTGIFYENTLTSEVDNQEIHLNLPDEVVNPAGGPSLVLTEMSLGDDCPTRAIEGVADWVKRILEKDPKKQIAVLAHKIRTVAALQKAIASKVGNKKGVLVETVARIQGLTTDVAIFLVPNTRYAFSLERRLFNVATSRARENTIILADRSVLACSDLDADVRRYLELLSGTSVRTAVVSPSPKADLKPDADAIDLLSDSLPAESASTVSAVSDPTLAQLQGLLNRTQVLFAQWLQANLQKAYHSQDIWRTAVLNALLPQQKETVLNNDWTSIDELDFATLVAVFLSHENLTALKRVVKIDPEAADLAKHIKKIRNINAHRGAKGISNPDVKDIRYHISTLERFGSKLGLMDKDTPSGISVLPIRTDKPASTVLKRGACTIVVH